MTDPARTTTRPVAARKRMYMGLAAAIPIHIPRDRVFDFDLYNDLRIDTDVPGALARALQDAPDVFWTPRNGGHWIAQRFHAISRIVRDAEHFSCRETQIPRAPNRNILIPLNLDPPDNIPYRRVLMPVFSAMAVRRMEPRLRELAADCVAAVADRGRCDFAQEVAARYPIVVLMDLFGLSGPARATFETLALRHVLEGGEDPFEGPLAQILKDLIKARRQAPSSDLISRLLATDIDGRRLVTGELVSICSLLFLSAMDTVTHVLAFAYQNLAKDTALQARLAGRPQLVPEFVEEALRLYAQVSNPRVVAKDCQRFGVTFRTGEMIACVLAMAGRDGRVNPDPDTFDIDREKKRHLAFSSGPHECIGHILARAELRILTEEWLKRVPSFDAVGPASAAARLGGVTALNSLPLRYLAATVD